MWIGFTFYEDAQECRITRSRQQQPKKKIGVRALAEQASLGSSDGGTKVALSRSNLFQRWRGAPLPVQVFTDPVVAVAIETEDTKYGAKGHRVVLEFEDGRVQGITSTCTIGPIEDQVRVAEKLAGWFDVPIGTEVGMGTDDVFRTNSFEQGADNKKIK